MAQSVTLEWDPNSEPDLAGYNIYRSQQSGSGYVKLNSSLIQATSYTDDTIQYGVTYYYVATAVNTSGLESGYSNEVAYTAQLPPQPPVAVDDVASVNEDGVVTVPVLANDSDPNGDPLQIVAVGSPPVGSVNYTTSEVIYTPPPNWWGVVSFSYTVSDGAGGQASATVTVTVVAVNDPPVANDDTLTVAEDGSGIVYPLTNDSDPDGETLTISAVGSARHGRVTTVAGNGLQYVPSANFYGTDAFSYTVQDPAGATATATVRITITPVNDLPVAQDNSVTTAESQPVTVTVLANDSDPDGDALTLLSLGSPLHGTAVRNSDQTVTYTPDPNFAGEDSFSYTVSDGNGGSSNALVVVTVIGEREAPVANDDAATTPEDQPLVVSVLANDSDPDGDELRVVAVSSPSHGTASLEGTKAVRYVPAPNFFGSDTFTYTVSDGFFEDVGTVMVTVTPVNDPPVPADDTVEVAAGDEVLIAVLANDTDVDGDSLVVESVGEPAHGAAELLGDFRIRYRPADTFVGEDIFSYRVSDGQVSREGIVRVIVVGKAGEPKTLVFPATVDTGTSPQFRDTFVGLGLVNSGGLSETLVLESRTRGGNRLARADWVGLQPRAQVAALTSELPVYQPGAVALAVEAPRGEVQGFFMVGDYALKRLDGVGAALTAGRELVFPLVREDGSSATLVQMMNPSSTEIAWLSLWLHDAEGRILRKVNAAIAPGGSFMGTVGEIFGGNQKVVDGYVKVKANVPVTGYEAVASQGALASVGAQQGTVVSHLFAPHVFADGRGGESRLYLLSEAEAPVAVRIRIRDDAGAVVAESERTLSPGRLEGVSTAALWRSAGWSERESVSGALEVELSEPAPVIAGVLHETTGRKASAYVPLEAAGRRETVFPQVAVTAGGIFTGLAVSNPNETVAHVTVQVYDETGQLVAEQPFQLVPGGRRVGLLSDGTFFGPEFQRSSGHLRVLSDVPTVSNALFGDYRGEYLSAIQGQGVE